MGTKTSPLEHPASANTFDLVYDERLQELKRRHPVLVPSKKLCVNRNDAFDGSVRCRQAEQCVDYAFHAIATHRLHRQLRFGSVAEATHLPGEYPPRGQRVEQPQPRIFWLYRMHFDDMVRKRGRARKSGLRYIRLFGFLARHGQFMVRRRTAAIWRISSASSANSSGRIDCMPSERALSGW